MQRRIKTTYNVLIGCYILSIIYQAVSIFMLNDKNINMAELIKTDSAFAIRFVTLFMFIISMLAFIKIADPMTKKSEIDYNRFLVLLILFISQLLLQQVVIIVGYVIFIYLLGSHNLDFKKLFFNLNFSGLGLELSLSIIVLLINAFVLFAYYKI